ncbi:MAG TPA: phenylalanine--tRNA ligase subunit alpha [Longimicrobiales bacterium]|nr:phenylalanine--tRNA ligase subunit alpha [Longimicrobiales bacterium]
MTDTTDLDRQLDALEAEGLAAIEAAATAAELDAARIRLLGRKEGRLTSIMRGLGGLSPEARPAAGAKANRVKQVLSEALDAREADLSMEGPGDGARTDLSLPARRDWAGAQHPVTRVIDEICTVLARLGFTRARGPEAETDWYNFTALNTPLDHPAADMHDTFYLAPGVLLRSHTSPVQIRTMQSHQPPIRIVAPGMVYRRDPFDASHAPGFDQLEGLAVDEGITFVDLKATLAEFARGMFGEDARVRFRPSYFPFTEPSAEVDVSCLICGGGGCSACKGTGWIEIMGAGMVHPSVFEHAGYDPERYTGFAFGMGPGRIAMLRYGIPDIRLLYDTDIRFLQQFSDLP